MEAKNDTKQNKITQACKEKYELRCTTPQAPSGAVPFWLVRKLKRTVFIKRQFWSFHSFFIPNITWKKPTPYRDTDILKALFGGLICGGAYISYGGLAYSLIQRKWERKSCVTILFLLCLICYSGPCQWRFQSLFNHMMMMVLCRWHVGRRAGQCISIAGTGLVIRAIPLTFLGSAISTLSQSSTASLNFSSFISET